MTSTFVPLPKDVLEVQKTMDKPTIVVALGKELDPNEKVTAADLKIGAGMSPQIQEAFEKPVFKTNKVVIGGEVSKRKMSQETEKTGAGVKKRPKMFSGRGIMFT